MKTKQTILKNLGVAGIAVLLIACNSPEERKAKYMAEGKQLLEEGEYDKAALAFKNVQQIDPKYWDNHYYIAEVLSKQGKIEQAFREYNLVVVQDENHVMARVRLAQLFLLNHNFDQAEKFDEEALAKEPDNVEALVLKASLQNIKKDNDTATTTIEKALSIKPDDVWATMMLASINLSMEKQDKAISILKTYLEKHPDSVPTLSMLGGIYAKNRQFTEAEQYLVASIAAEPKKYQHYRTLARFQAALRQDDKAEATLRDAVQKLPDLDEPKTDLMDFLVEKRNPDFAIAELLPMIDKKPDDYELRFKLAALQKVKKDYAGVETTLKEVIEMDKLGPNGIKARDKLAGLYVLNKREDEAKALIKEVLDANPRDSESLTFRGEFALDEGRVLEAIADFRSVLVDQPNNTGVLKLLAAAHIRNNEESLARENLEKIVTINPGDEVARTDLASLLLKVGQKDQAKQQIEALLKVNPKSLRGNEALFKIHVADKQWDKAQEIAKKLQQQNADDPIGFYMSGLAYEAANKLEFAADAFQQALLKKPDAIEPLNELIKTYMAAKQADKAIAKLQQVIKQQSQNMIAYNLLGGIYLSEQKFSDAQSSFNKALEIKPDWYSPYRSLAMLELVQKNQTGAINILKKGIEATKGNLEIVLDLAKIYNAEGQHNKVIALYDEAYKYHPDSIIFQNALATYLINHSSDPADLARAAKLAEGFYKTNNASLLDTAAWVSYKQGHYDKARDTLLQVVDIDPHSLIAYYHLGMTYFQLNDKVKAGEYLQKVVDAKTAFDGLEVAKETLKKIHSGT